MPSVTSALGRVLGSKTSFPVDLLVSRALAQSDLAKPLPSPTEPGAGLAAAAPQRWLRKLLPVATAGLAALAVVMFIGQSVRQDPSRAAAGARGVAQQPAQLRILAHPWAEIHIDGQPIDVTPIGRPLEVTPGRHVVQFRHPHAPTQTRTVELIAGQTVLLDVNMAVKRPDRDKVPKAKTPEQESP